MEQESKAPVKRKSKSARRGIISFIAGFFAWYIGVTMFWAWFCGLPAGGNIGKALLAFFPISFSIGVLVFAVIVLAASTGFISLKNYSTNKQLQPFTVYRGLAPYFMITAGIFSAMVLNGVALSILGRRVWIMEPFFVYLIDGFLPRCF